MVGGLSAARSLAYGSDGFAVAADSSGQVWTAGTDAHGELGDGAASRSTFGQVPSLSGVTSVIAGYDLVGALKSDGTVWAWGYVDAAKWHHVGTPTAVAGLTNIKAISGPGDEFRSNTESKFEGETGDALAVHSDGTVSTWRRVQDSSSGTFSNWAIADVPGLGGVSAVAAADDHQVALKSDGTVWAWGDNTYGQLGNGTTGPADNTPHAVPGLTGISAIAAGRYFTLARKSDGTVWAWGADDAGQLGDGGTVDQTSPHQIPGLTNITAINAGRANGIAVGSDGKVRVWGSSGYHGATGTGPVLVSEINHADVAGAGNIGLVSGTGTPTVAPSSPPSPSTAGPNRAPVFTTTPGTDAVFPPVIGQRTVVVAATDPDGDPVTLTWSPLPAGPVQVTCDPAASATNPASVTCHLTQVRTAGVQADVVFTATDSHGAAATYKLALGAGQYVALGDSFSAGEGNPPYYAGTDFIYHDMCHRSYAAYSNTVDATLPSLRSAPDFFFQACSGATVATMTLGSISNGEGSQYTALTPATTLVTLSIGGNDADFANILKACTQGTVAHGVLDCLNQPYGKAGKNLSAYLPDLLAAVQTDVQCPQPIGARCDPNRKGSYTVPSLHQVYEDIHTRAPNAKIVVLLYPHLFTDQATEQNPNMIHLGNRRHPGPLVCPVGSASGRTDSLVIGADTMQRLNKGADELDTVILGEIDKAKAAGVPDIVAADPRPAFSSGPDGGHGLCGSRLWINSVSLGPNTTPPSLTDPSTWKPIGPRPESYHPNGKGQAAFATAILAKISG